MPKLKTIKSASKRFKQTASGAFKHRGANRNHILTKKSKKRKSHLRPMGMVHKSDMKSVEKMLIQR